MTTPLLVAPVLPALPTIRQVLAGEATWRVPLPAPEILLPDGVRELDIVGLSLRAACAELRTVRANKNGQAFDVNIVAATTTLVRDGGIVPLDAWREDMQLFFPNNPAILWQHNSSIGPIGSAVAVELRGRNENGRMLQWWRFNDVSEQSQTAHTLFALGEMRAASVGFIIRAWHKVSEEELKKLQKKHPAAHEWTWIVDRAELIETSAVSVGADPAALALSAGESATRDAFDELGVMYAYGRTYETDRHYAKALATRCASGDGDACQVLIDGFAGDDDNRTAIPFSAHGGVYAVAPKNTEWNAGAELDAMSGKSKELMARHAWVNRDADLDTKAAYTFPHHRAVSNKGVVFRALAAGFARLGSVKMEKADKDSIADHLGRHYRDDFDVEPPDREAVEIATASLGAARGNDDALDAWLAAHRETLARLGGGCVTYGAELVVAESMQRTLDANAIRVDGLSTDEVRTFIVGQLARVISTEAREAHDRLKKGRTP